MEKAALDDKYRKIAADAEKAEMNRKIQGAQQALGAIAALNEAFAGDSKKEQKKAFQRNKKIGIVSAVISTAGAVIAALDRLREDWEYQQVCLERSQQQRQEQPKSQPSLNQDSIQENLIQTHQTLAKEAREAHLNQLEQQEEAHLHLTSVSWVRVRAVQSKRM